MTDLTEVLALLSEYGETESARLRDISFQDSAEDILIRLDLVDGSVLTFTAEEFNPVMLSAYDPDDVYDEDGSSQSELYGICHHLYYTILHHRARYGAERVHDKVPNFRHVDGDNPYMGTYAPEVKEEGHSAGIEYPIVVFDYAPGQDLWDNSEVGWILQLDENLLFAPWNDLVAIETLVRQSFDIDECKVLYALSNPVRAARWAQALEARKRLVEHQSGL